METGSGGRWSRIARRALLVLFVFFATLALVTTWLASELLDDDRYVATMTELAANEAIQDVVARAVTDRLVDRFVSGDTAGSDATASLFSTEGLTRVASIQLIDRTVHQVVGSAAFQDLWASANRIAHPRLVALLRGDPVAGVNLTGGQVVVDLAPVVTDVQARLRDAGLPQLIPEGNREFTLVLFESTELATAVRAVDLLVTLRWLLPVLALLAAAGFVWRSPDRSRAVATAGLALALGMVLVIVALALVRGLYIDDRSLGAGEGVTRAFFDILAQPLRVSARGLALLGVLVAGVAWLLAPANAWRSAVNAFVTRNRTLLYSAILALGAMAIILPDHPSLTVLAGTAIVTVVAVALVWWLARPTRPETAAP